jgi:hypothetical protein
MTSSITPVTAASNGGNTTEDKKDERPSHGLPALRDTEAKALIHLGMEALHETSNVGHELHQLVYGTTEPDEDKRQELLVEALTCLETAEHYLLMFGGASGDHPARTGPPGAAPE